MTNAVMSDAVKAPVGELMMLPVSAWSEKLTGIKPSPATIWRWRTKGSRGSRLQCVMIFGRWSCSKEQFLAFLAGTSSTAPMPKTAPATDDAALAAAGLL